MRSRLSSTLCAVLIALTMVVLCASGCSPELIGDAALTQNVRLELVDWHISGLWVINCPVCWLRVENYNHVPITDITVSYVTYDFDGKPLDKGKYTIDGTVGPGAVKNFIEQYIGLVSLESDKISIKLDSVRGGEGGGH